MSAKITSRIAPTPSGFLHAGNAFSFVLTWVLVRLNNGKLILRIDDLDAARRRDEYIEDIFDSLRWLGVDYDEGATTLQELKDKYSQTLKKETYNDLIAQLEETKLTYYCDCSRRQIRAINAHGIYPNTCRDLLKKSEEGKTSQRLKVLNSLFKDTIQKLPSLGFTKEHYQVNLEKELGDFIIKRKDGIAAYQIASLADDIAMGVNFIVRGEDLLTSTYAQLYIASVLQKEAFLSCHFYHHQLITNSFGEKLSKSEGATSLKQMREEGYLPSNIYKLVGDFLGLGNREYESITKLLETARNNGLGFIKS